MEASEPGSLRLDAVTAMCMVSWAQRRLALAKTTEILSVCEFSERCLHSEASSEKSTGPPMSVCLIYCC